MTFLKWAGGKRGLIPQISPFLPREFEAYHEPFLGGGAMFFHLMPRIAYLYDLNPRLINAYVQVRDHLEPLISILTEFQGRHSEDFYYEQRSAFNNRSSSDLEQAAQFIYLNKTGFNGLFRENRRGEFNTPCGRYDRPNICDRVLLTNTSSALQRTWIECADFRSSLSMTAIDAGDFVYLDPPYVPLNKTSKFAQYTSKDFTEKDQEDLRDLVHELHSSGVQVMLSNSDCEFTRNLYRDFQIFTVQAKRNINSNVNERGKIVSEILVTTYPVTREVAA